MESIQKEKDTSSRITLADRVRKLEESKKLAQRSEETMRRAKQFRWPFRWRMKFNKAKRKSMRNMLLVIFLNKKNQIEPPKFMPIFDGNMVVWKNKPYEFDPRAMWTIMGMKRNPQTYLIKEIDRRPVRNKFEKIVYADAAVSNMDLDEIRKRGDSTESDEFLIKAALKAQTAQGRKKANIAVLIVVALVVAGVLWFLLSGS